MRKVFSILLLVFLAGCAYKHQSLQFEPFKPQDFSLQSSPFLEKIYLKSVVDERVDKRALGTIYDSNKNAITYASSNQNISLWIYDGLKKAFEAKGFKVINEPAKEAKVVKIYLKELGARYDEGILKEDNLSANMALRAEIKRGDKSTTKDISQGLKKWHKPIKDTKAFEAVLQELMQEVLERSVREIVKY